VIAAHSGREAILAWLGTHRQTGSTNITAQRTSTRLRHIAVSANFGYPVFTPSLST